MLIQVIRNNNQYDYVQDYMLESLLETNQIIKFRRSTGWVTVGIHSMRKREREKAFNDKDHRGARDSTSAREYRKAYLSSLGHFQD